ncbi:MAG: phosphatase PAP2 family protein [Euryarchaeota archaeon]|nr:phosphatase PAP2 family protein [Euryarchaeota archaeon]
MSESFIQTLNNIDILMFYIINVKMQNSVFNVIMPIITYAGTLIFWIIICIILFIFGGEKGKNVAFLCLTALIISFFISEILKLTFARPRPPGVLEGINILVNMGGYSFPSGHSVTSFTGCTVIGKKYGYLYPLLIAACIVGFSRIYIGVHYPFDVVMGAIVGILCALAVLRLEDHILNIKNKIEHIMV